MQMELLTKNLYIKKLTAKTVIEYAIMTISMNEKCPNY